MQTRRDIVFDNPVFIELRRRCNMTPDFFDLLYDQEEYLLFVYDHLKVGFKNNPFYLNNSKYLGKAHTFEKRYHLKQSHTFPIMMERPIGTTGALQVKGEVYAVSMETMLKIDALMSNTQLFNREKHYVVLEEQKTPTKGSSAQVRSCFAYVGVDKVWENAQLHFTSKMVDMGKEYWNWFKPNSDPLAN